MKMRMTFVLVASMLLILAPSAWAQGPQMSVGQAIQHDTSPPMSEMKIVKPKSNSLPQEVNPIVGKPDFGQNPANATPDGGLQAAEALIAPMAPTPAPLVSAPGLSEQDNISTVGTGIVPPDVNGDIGLDENGNKIYIQYINLIWGIYRASDGAQLHGPFPGNSFWTGFGGPCETTNDGDPIVLYDDQAGQWFFSQFAINSGVQCVAISTTSNPLGPYHRYAFAVTPGGGNDYPKLGVWADGGSQSAYTFTLRDFGGAGGAFSVSAGVMERDAMLNGNAAQFIKFSNPCVAGDCIEGQLPPHLAGGPPPAGTCPTYWAAVDSAYDDSPHANDGYRNHTLCVDWNNIGNSTYGENPLVVAGSNFDRFLGDGFSNCITPVNGGEALDCLAAFTMNRVQYRSNGTNGSVVFNTTVDAGGDRGGIRWTQNVSADGQTGWALQQDGTFAPNDGLDRWMGSIAADGDGNLALGYSVAGASLFPSVRYTTRAAGDAPGTLPGGEMSCHEGTGAQVASANRWGDYSSMSVDPVDDCTFWYTQEYYETTTSFDFKTRICSFKLADCGTPCVPTEDPEATCDDGADNDCDGNFDCFDPDCDGAPACQCMPEPEVCNNGSDDDCDELVDCDDPDCDLDPACIIPPAPDNDDCVDAEEIICPEGGGSVTVSGSTTMANFDGAPFCGTANTAPGVWYKVSHDGLLTASTCNAANYDTKISVYDGGCGALGCVGGNDDTAGCAGFTTEVSFGGDGSEQLILVHGFGTGVGDFDLTVTCATAAENDDCEDAIGPLAVGSVTAGSTTNATADEPPDIDCGTSVTAPGVWYTVTGTGNTMTASTCNDANFDTKISVYCADCENKECITGNDDTTGCSGFSTQTAWATQAGATYNVFVHGFGSNTGDFNLTILDDGVASVGANDCDGIDEAFDICPGSTVPESVPTSGSLAGNNSAVLDNSGFFTTADPNPQGLSFSLAETGGCTCEQIVDALGVGEGHLINGCSPGIMDNWVDFLADQSCGNCVEAHGGIGCETAACEAEVCAIDSFCCAVAWDGICAAEALDLCVPEICLALPASIEGFHAEVEGGRNQTPALDPNAKVPPPTKE